MTYTMISAFCILIEILEGMVPHFGLSFFCPFNYVVTCWSLVLDATLSFLYMLNVYMAYYNSTCIHNAEEALKKNKKHKTSELEAKLVKKEKNQ